MDESTKLLIEMLRRMQITVPNEAIKEYLDKCEQLLVECHNKWLNGELVAKVVNILQLRDVYREFAANTLAELAEVERKYKESCDSLTLSNSKVRELEAMLAVLEAKLAALEEDFSSTKDRSSAEIARVKQNSEEWSKKAGELEGIITSSETRLNEVEKEHKKKLEAEESSRNKVEKECALLKEKLEACKTELKSLKKENELKDPPRSSLKTNLNTVDASEIIALAGISGTALAALLLRDGWSLDKMYDKYKQAVDALSIERLERQETEADLDLILSEIKVKAALIMEERAEHAKLVEAYSALSQKLQDLSEKELSCGSCVGGSELDLHANLSLVDNLVHQIEEKEAQLKKYEKNLQELGEDTESKINAMRSVEEKQGNMIESLRDSVSMYKKLYEEEQKHRNELLALQKKNVILDLKAKFAEENFARVMKDFEDQVFVLKEEKEILQISENRATEEVRCLSDKIYNLEVDDFSLLKESFQKLQVNVRQKDAMFEEVEGFILKWEEATLSLVAKLRNKETKIRELKKEMGQIKRKYSRLLLRFKMFAEYSVMRGLRGKHLREERQG